MTNDQHDQTPETAQPILEPVISDVSRNQDTAITPLNNARYERFAIAVFQGRRQNLAYKEHINPNATAASCRSGASRLMRLPEIVARLAVLRAATLQHSQIADQLDNAGMRARLDTIARYGSAQESISAIKQLREWDQEDKQQAQDDATPNPCIIARYFSNYAGRQRTKEELRGVLVELAKLFEITIDELVALARPIKTAAITPADSPPGPFITASDGFNKGNKP
jgi:hypothetical protein